MSEFDNLRTLHAATTPGEWQANHTLVTTDGVEYPNDVVASTTENESWERNRADAAFIVAAHNELPALLARLDEVTAEKDALAAVIEKALDFSPEDRMYDGGTLGSRMRKILAAAPSSVMAAHDAKVRAEALRDAAQIVSERQEFEAANAAGALAFMAENLRARADEEENR